MKLSLKRALSAFSLVVVATGLVGQVAQAQPLTLDTQSKILVLGDSYMAEPGIEAYVAGTGSASGMSGNACFRSQNNYAARIGRTLGAHVIDVSCTSATPANIMRTPQFPNHGQGLQIDTVRNNPDAAAVLLSIGGNDPFPKMIMETLKLGLFSRQPITETNPTWQYAYNAYVDRGPNSAYAMIVEANREIQRLAPNATLYQVNYNRLLPTPEQGIGRCGHLTTPESIVPLNTLQDMLNTMVEDAARDSGAVLVDLTAPGTPWTTSGDVHMCSDTPATNNLLIDTPAHLQELLTPSALGATTVRGFHHNEWGVELTRRTLEMMMQSVQPTLFN